MAVQKRAAAAERGATMGAAKGGKARRGKAPRRAQSRLRILGVAKRKAYINVLG